MANKMLSNSTLSLKFMQNAQRAKQLKEVEVERAQVQDDGKWEISPMIRDSWRMHGTQLQHSEIYEESYMPFLFSKNNDTGDGLNNPVKAAGRRIFNKNGQEVSVEQPETITTESVSPSDTATSIRGRKVHPKPVSISSTGKSVHLRGFEDFSGSRGSKTARQAIFENGGVGTDLREQARIHPESSSTTMKFMKPMGVDDPRDMQTSSTPTPVASNTSNIIVSARQMAKRVREHDDTSGAGQTPKKPKKKKKKNPE